MTNTQRTLIVLSLLAALILLAGCSSRQTGSAAAPEVNIECQVAYRSSVEVEIEREERISLSKTATAQSLELQDLAVHAQYWPPGTAPGEHAVRLAVTPANSAAELAAQLFQLPLNEPVRNQFSSGHGFTGLGYVYHPTTGAELQYTCSVQE